jgi:hypothetical protein
MFQRLYWMFQRLYSVKTDFISPLGPSSRMTFSSRPSVGKNKRIKA